MFNGVPIAETGPGRRGKKSLKGAERGGQRGREGVINRQHIQIRHVRRSEEKMALVEERR